MPPPNISPVSSTSASWQNNKLLAAAMKDPKKVFVLAALVGVLGIMWGRMLMKSGSGPNAAAAAMAASEGSGVATNTTGMTGSVPSSATSQNSAAAAALQEWVRKPITPMTRNLFAIKLDYFPQDAARISQTLRKPEGDGFWDELAKSMLREADQRKERQLLLENLRLRVTQDLKLQTTMMGATPKALINGELVKEGDVVASFRVLKIEARRVIIEREGIKLEVMMK